MSERYTPTLTIVHPRVYRQRAECPEWTNRPNPKHVHSIDCKWPVKWPVK